MCFMFREWIEMVDVGHLATKHPAGTKTMQCPSCVLCVCLCVCVCLFYNDHYVKVMCGFAFRCHFMATHFSRHWIFIRHTTFIISIPIETYPFTALFLTHFSFPFSLILYTNNSRLQQNNQPTKQLTVHTI